MGELICPIHGYMSFYNVTYDLLEDYEKSVLSELELLIIEIKQYNLIFEYYRSKGDIPSWMNRMMSLDYYESNLDSLETGFAICKKCFDEYLDNNKCTVNKNNFHVND